MEKNLFREVYKQVCGLALKDCPPSSLSGLLHGYLSVYSMVRVYPWLEDEYGSLWDIHDRIREIARIIQELLKNKDLPVDTRAGYVVDLMDAYLLYSDMSYLTDGLDVAYALLTSHGEERIQLPCRTPNVCRMLCNCYYFAGDKECGELAGRLVTEVLGYIRGEDREVLQSWWQVIVLYQDVVGEATLSLGDRKWLDEEVNRLHPVVERVENEMIDRFRQAGASTELVAGVFEILAGREYAGCLKLI